MISMYRASFNDLFFVLGTGQVRARRQDRWNGFLRAFCASEASVQKTSESDVASRQASEQTDLNFIHYFIFVK